MQVVLYGNTRINNELPDYERHHRNVVWTNNDIETGRDTFQTFSIPHKIIFLQSWETLCWRIKYSTIYNAIMHKYQTACRFVLLVIWLITINNIRALPSANCVGLRLYKSDRTWEQALSSISLSCLNRSWLRSRL